MGLRACLAPIIKLVLLITYAVYIVFGLLMMVVGAYVWSEIEGVDTTAVAGMCIAGIFMMIVGGGAIYATMKENWLILFGILIADLVLFIGMFVACIVGWVVINEVQDPVTETIEKVYGRTNVRINTWLNVREVSDNQGGPPECRLWGKSVDEETDVGHALHKKFTAVQAAGNCSMISLELDKTHARECELCWKAWEKYTIDKLKSVLWPATYSVFALFGFACVAAALASYIVETSDPDEDAGEDDPTKWSPSGLLATANMALSGIVCFFGLLVVIFGVYAHFQLSDCPEGESCTNWAVIMIIILGVFFMVIPGVTLGSQKIGGVLGKLIMQIMVWVYVAFSVVLLFVGICFAVVSGGVDSINEEYDLRFPQIRAAWEKENPGYCQKLSDAKCKAKIKDAVEGDLKTVGVILVIGIVGFIFVMYVTMIAVKLYHGSSADDDDGGDGPDEEETRNPTRASAAAVSDD